MDYNNSVLLRAGLLTARVITGASDKIQAHRLRYRVYCEELGWRPLSIDKLERDAYDNNESAFLGVFDEKGELLSFLRVNRYYYLMDSGFDEFSSYRMKFERSKYAAEITRFCVERSARAAQTSESAGELIIEFLVEFCKQNNIGVIYFVVEPKTFVFLRNIGMGAEKMSGIKIMDDGCKALLASFRIDRFKKNRLSRYKIKSAS